MRKHHQGDALTRLPILQHEIDTAAGLNTGGFISGYRGSPLGGLDQALWRAKTHLDLHNIEFVPGINEELAATCGRRHTEITPALWQVHNLTTRLFTRCCPHLSARRHRA